MSHRSLAKFVISDWKHHADLESDASVFPLLYIFYFPHPWQNMSHKLFLCNNICMMIWFALRMYRSRLTHLLSFLWNKMEEVKRKYFKIFLWSRTTFYIYCLLSYLCWYLRYINLERRYAKQEARFQSTLVASLFGMPMVLHKYSHACQYGG